MLLIREITPKKTKAKWHASVHVNQSNQFLLNSKASATQSKSIFHLDEPRKSSLHWFIHHKTQYKTIFRQTMTTSNFDYDCDSFRTDFHSVREYNRARLVPAFFNTTGLTVTASLPDGTMHEIPFNLITDRIECNKFINPVVSAVRKHLGVPHAYKSCLRIMPNHVYKSNRFVRDEEGEYMMLADWTDDENFQSYFSLAFGYFEKYFQEKNYSRDIQEKIVKLTLVNRYHVSQDNEELGKDFEVCYHTMIIFVVIEGALGYNGMLPMCRDGETFGFYNRQFNYENAWFKNRLLNSSELDYNDSCDSGRVQDDQDRDKCNRMIDPLVEMVRKRYGVVHRLVDNPASEFMFVPDWTIKSVMKKYISFSLGYLEKVFEEYTAEDKHETVRLVLINRFHVDENDIGLNMDSTICYHRMITYAMMEAALGYNRAHQLWIDANVTQYINDETARIEG